MTLLTDQAEVALCQCGCGQPAPVARRNEKKSGVAKGQPLRFIHGHGGRGSGHQGCDEPGCPNPHKANGYCSAHDARLRSRGTTAPGPRSLSPVEHFWTKVDKNGPVPGFRPELGPCWLWQGTLLDGSYGQIGTRKKPTSSGTNLAHRASYELAGREIPDGFQLDHLCRVRRCVNPSHLDPVTPKVNTERGLHGELRTHCSKAHELTPENTYLQPTDNSRKCRTCMAEDDAEARRDPVRRERKLAASRRWKACRRERLATQRAERNAIEGYGT